MFLVSKEDAECHLSCLADGSVAPVDGREQTIARLKIGSPNHANELGIILLRAAKEIAKQKLTSWNIYCGPKGDVKLVAEGEGGYERWDGDYLLVTEWSSECECADEEILQIIWENQQINEYVVLWDVFERMEIKKITDADPRDLPLLMTHEIMSLNAKKILEKRLRG